jgi:mono/diheme cytochrome c family protein
MMKYFLTIAFPFFLGLVACNGGEQTAVLPTPSPLAPLPVPTLAVAVVAAGEQIYRQVCASCHGSTLEGQTNWKEQNEDGSFRAPPHNAMGHTWHHADSDLVDAIRRGGVRLPAQVGGTSNMPAYADLLTDEEITAVLDYIKNSWPADIRQAQWEQTLRQDRRNE